MLTVKFATSMSQTLLDNFKFKDVQLKAVLGEISVLKGLVKHFIKKQPRDTNHYYNFMLH